MTIRQDNYDDVRLWRVGLGEIGRERCPEIYIFVAATDLIIAGQLALEWAEDTRDSADPRSLSELVSIELVTEFIIAQPGCVVLEKPNGLYYPALNNLL